MSLASVIHNGGAHCRARRSQPRAVCTRCSASLQEAFSRRQLLSAAAVTVYTLSRAPRPVIAAPESTEVREALAAALTACVPAGKATAVLRLAFHDAGTFNVAAGDGGPNGSVVFELDRPESFGLKRGLKPVLDARTQLAGTAAENVSLADLIQVAGAHAVRVTGGPLITVPLGRLDAPAPDPEGRMPAETLAAPELVAHFAAAGYSVRELVALAGAHTIGGKGFGAPLTFDNAYYKTLLARPWSDPTASADARAMASHIGLPSDQGLPDDAACLAWIQRYAADQDAWFDDFSAAYLKMGIMGASWRKGATVPGIVSLS